MGRQGDAGEQGAARGRGPGGAGVTGAETENNEDNVSDKSKSASTEQRLDIWN